MKYIWLKGQRGTKLIMNIMVVLLAKKAFYYDIEGVNSKNVLLALLACSGSPSFYMKNSINL